MSICSSGSASGSGSGGGGGGGGGGGSGSGGPCGACKFLRRKCVHGCIFAPYFDAEQGASHFAAVHKVFGASNVSKLLLHLPKEKRLDAVVTICYEAQARLRDPVYGCVGHIFALHQQVMALQTELSYLHAHLASLEMPPPPPPPPVPMQVASFSVENLPTSAAETPSTLDLSTLFDPMVQQSMWAPPAQQQHQQQEQFGSTGDDGALQALARELLDRSRPGSSTGSPPPPPPTSK